MSLQHIASIHRTSPLRRRLPSIACGILLTAFAGCSDNRSTTLGDDLPSVGNPVEINILTNGIESFADAEEVATRSALAGSTEAVQTVQTLHTQVQPLEDGRLLVATLKASKATRAAAASPIGTRATLTNTTLRVLAYNSEGQYVDDCIYNVDGSGTATMPSGQSLVVPARATPYTFYCYSPASSACNTETKDVSVGADAFAFGTQIATINSSSTQTIAFPTLAQKSAMIKLAVTSDDGAVSCTATLTGTFTNSATFNLASDAYTSFGSASVQTKNFGSNGAEIIIPLSGTTGEMTLTLSSLVVNGGALSSLPIKIPAITLVAGTKYTLAIKVNTVLPKAPYVVLPSVGLKVAKGNLMRANGTGHWYLAPDQGYYTSNATGGDYFSWGIDNPTSYGVNIYDRDDADAVTAGCAAVLGAGWRVPTKADNEKLAAGANVWGTYTSQRGTSKGRYFGTSNVPSADKQDDYVFLPAAGYRDFSNGSMNYVDSFGLYWSSEFYGRLNAHSFYFSSSSINGDIDYRSNGLSVRCVTDY